MKIENFKEKLVSLCEKEYHAQPKELTANQLHCAVSKLVMEELSPVWDKSRTAHDNARKASYLSMEFLVGRAIYNNLLCLGILDSTAEELKALGVDISEFEEVEDAALGNGGLGRLAACFLDSAAALDLPLDGYGIRYKYGLFKQGIKDGFQTETADDWQRYGDPWSVRREQETVVIHFADGDVNAVPYDYPVIGYGTENEALCDSGRLKPTMSSILTCSTAVSSPKPEKRSVPPRIFPVCFIPMTKQRQERYSD